MSPSSDCSLRCSCSWPPQDCSSHGFSRNPPTRRLVGVVLLFESPADARRTLDLKVVDQHVGQRYAGSRESCRAESVHHSQEPLAERPFKPVRHDRHEKREKKEEKTGDTGRPHELPFHLPIVPRLQQGRGWKDGAAICVLRTIRLQDFNVLEELDTASRLKEFHHSLEGGCCEGRRERGEETDAVLDPPTPRVDALRRICEFFVQFEPARSEPRLSSLEFGSVDVALDDQVGQPLELCFDRAKFRFRGTLGAGKRILVALGDFAPPPPPPPVAGDFAPSSWPPPAAGGRLPPPPPPPPGLGPSTVRVGGVWRQDGDGTAPPEPMEGGDATKRLNDALIAARVRVRRSSSMTRSRRWKPTPPKDTMRFWRSASNLSRICRVRSARGSRDGRIRMRCCACDGKEIQRRLSRSNSHTWQSLPAMRPLRDRSRVKGMDFSAPTSSRSFRKLLRLERTMRRS